MDNTSNDFLALFLETARDHVSKMQKLLFSQGIQDSNLEELHRHAHSLKGEFAAMGYQHSARLSHLLEVIFANARQGTTTISPAYASLVEKSLEQLSGSLQSIETSKAELDLEAWTVELSRGTGVSLPEGSQK